MDKLVAVGLPDIKKCLVEKIGNASKHQFEKNSIHKSGEERDGIYLFHNDAMYSPKF